MVPAQEEQLRLPGVLLHFQTQRQAVVCQQPPIKKEALFDRGAGPAA